MAEVQMYVKVDGTDGEDAVPVIQQTVRVLAQALGDAGHLLVIAKVAIMCQCCGGLINPGRGTLCNDCAYDEVVERQLHDERIVMPVEAIQPAESVF